MKINRTLLYFLLIPVLAVNVWCGASLLRIVDRESAVKEDYAEVNSIRNGLLSVGVWKTHLQKIATTKLSHFELTAEEEQAVRDAVEKALNMLIAGTDQMMQKPQKTFKGKMKKMAFRVFVDTQSLTQQTPQYAETVLTEVKKPENLAKIKHLALGEIKTAKDVGDVGDTNLKTLLNQYNVRSVEEFDQRIERMIHSANEKIHILVSAMVTSLCLFLLVWWLVRHDPTLHPPLYALSVIFAFILLISALALPMIDIDARIQNIDFLLLGEHMQFKNQLLFYRSKSIGQMVKILITSGSPMTVFVGFLILLFSVLFPVAKLCSTLIYLYGKEKVRRNKLLNFFAFKSGKWSMADVMVVAIFMAYIGFNGVLNGQLKNLNFQSETLGVIATNQTALQAGFTLFVAFVLFGLALSTILHKIVPHSRITD